MQKMKHLQRSAQAKRPKYKAHILTIDRLEKFAEKQGDLDMRLSRAAMDGDNAEIRRLIKRGANIAELDIDGCTALHTAAEFAPTKTCALILREYAKSRRDIRALITAKDNFGKTAMHLAAANGDKKTAQFLEVRLLKAMFGDEAAAAFLEPFRDCLSQ